MLTKKEVLYIAKLANLKLTQKEIEKFQPQLSKILDYVKKLEKVDTSGVRPVYHATSMKNRFSIDTGDETDCLTQQEVVKNTKDSKDGYILTKAVL